MSSEVIRLSVWWRLYLNGRGKSRSDGFVVLKINLVIRNVSAAFKKIVEWIR